MLRRFAGFFLLCLFTGTALIAQTDRAVLRGLVKDSSGASVTDAQISVTEIKTNMQVRTLTTNTNAAVATDSCENFQRAAALEDSASRLSTRFVTSRFVCV